MSDETIPEIVASPVMDDDRSDEYSLAVPEEDAAVSLKRVYLEDFSAPMTLSGVQRESYLRRFNTLFIDGARMREGSTSSIMHATNAFGEHFALKVRKVDESDAVNTHFEREYEAHRMLSGIKGYPKLYGRARLDGRPVLVMEWIEGEDLLMAMARMSVDDAGRLSPLTAARLGRDIFDVLARTGVLDSEIGHGDISLRNIMIGTSRQSIEEQTQEGVFDIRLIDLSSAYVSSDDRMDIGEDPDDWCHGAATPEFAAPEMRPDPSGSAAASPQGNAYERPKCTQASDVYAVASILCLLIYGDANPRFIGSRPKTAHDGDDDLFAVLRREPEVAVVLHRTISELASVPSAQEISEALSQVDEPLMALMRSCLADDPKKRPSAEEMHDALDSFCASYASNIGRALCGDVLEPCRAPFINKGVKRLSLRVRNLIRAFGKSVSIGLGAAVVVTMALLIQMKPLSIGIDAVKLDGFRSELMVVLLFLPIALGVLARGTRRDSIASLIRGSIGIAVGSAALVFLTDAAVFDPEAYEGLYRWAIFAVSVMSWCPFVLDAAFPVHAPRVRRRFRALPESKELNGTSAPPNTRTELLESLNVKPNEASDPDGQLYDGTDDVSTPSSREGAKLHDER